MTLRDAYSQKTDAQLRDWLAWIEAVKLRAGNRQFARADDQRRAVARLEDCYQLARLRHNELRSSSQAHWEPAKQALEKAMIDLKSALDATGVDQVGKYTQLQPDRSHIFEPFPPRKG